MMQNFCPGRNAPFALSENLDIVSGALRPKDKACEVSRRCVSR